VAAMTAVLAAALSLPTVLFTALFALSFAYWLLVLVGAVDLDGSGAEGAAKGAVEGIVPDGAHGVHVGGDAAHIDAGAHAHVGGVAHGDAGAHAGHAVPDGALGALLQAIGVRRAPLTVLVTLFALFGWVTAMLGDLVLGPSLGWFGRGLGFGAGCVVGLVAASVLSRPLAPVFAERKRVRRAEYVGKVATVSTGRVGPTFGQATLEDGGAGLILDIRHDREGALRRGTRVLLVDYDPTTRAYAAEPLDGFDSGPRARVGESEGEPAVESERDRHERKQS
jgi:hypothetical protein